MHEHVYSNGHICLSVLYDGKLNRLERCDECDLDLLFDYVDACQRV